MSLFPNKILHHEMHLPVTAIPAAFKLVKDAVILIERAQLTPQVLMDLKWSEAGLKGFPQDSYIHCEKVFNTTLLPAKAKSQFLAKPHIQYIAPPCGYHPKWEILHKQINHAVFAYKFNSNSITTENKSASQQNLNKITNDSIYSLMEEVCILLHVFFSNSSLLSKVFSQT